MLQKNQTSTKKHTLDKALRCEPKTSDALAMARRRDSEILQDGYGDLCGPIEVTGIKIPTSDGTMNVIAIIDPERKEQGKLKGKDNKYLLDVNAHKVLNALCIQAKFPALDPDEAVKRSQFINELTVTISIKILGELMNFTDMYNARKEILRATNALYVNKIRLKADNDEPTPSDRFYNGLRYSILDTVDLRQGYLYVVFSPVFYRALTDRTRSVVMYYPEELFALQENAYRIGWKLTRQAYSDIKNFSVKKIGDEEYYAYRLRVKTLVKAAVLPDYTPTTKKFTPEDKSPQARAARADGNRWVARTKEPLEAALKKVEEAEIIKDWYYTHAKGVKLTDEELARLNDCDMDYMEWSELYVEYVWAFDTEAKKRAAEKKNSAIPNPKNKKKRKATKAKTDTNTADSHHMESHTLEEEFKSMR